MCHSHDILLKNYHIVYKWNVYISACRPLCNSRSSSWWSGLTSEPLMSTVNPISIDVLSSVWPYWITVASGSGSEWKIPHSVYIIWLFSKISYTSVETSIITSIIRCRFLILLVESWSKVVFSGTVHWFGWRQAFIHYCGLLQVWRVPAFIHYCGLLQVWRVPGEGTLQTWRSPQ